MQKEELRPQNGHTGRALEHAPRAGAVQDLPGDNGFGDVVKDAINHVKVIVSDSVALGKLEVRRMAQRAEETGRDIVPRIAAGLTAAIVGLVGVVLGLVAIFVGLGAVIPSVAVRLAIFAAAFLLTAAAGGFFALRPRKVHHADVEPVAKITPPPFPTPYKADRPGEPVHMSR